MGKGKGAKILDKKQDSGAIVKLVEELRQAILLYQVCTVENRPQSRVNVFWIVIPTTIYRQSGRAIGRKFPPNLSPSELTGDWSNQVVFQRIFKTERGKGTRPHYEESTDI